MSSAVQMTIVVCTIDTFRTVSHLMKHLVVQEGRERCELIMVCPSQATLDLRPEECEGFASMRIIEVGPITVRGYALAEGLRAAAAPIVAFTEDHSFPEPGWVLGHMKAHEGPWAAVSATLINANTSSPISWADILTGHGLILAPQLTRETTRLGGHNVSYKRDVLLENFGDTLDEMLDTEPLHHDILLKRGYRIYLSAEARTRHTNFETFRGWLPSQFWHGRLYGACRGKHWTGLQRLKFILGSPLSPFVRIVRMYQLADTPASEFRRVPRLVHYLFIGITVSVLGEIIGCIAGSGNASRVLTRYEFHRNQFFNKKYHPDNSGYV